MNMPDSNSAALKAYTAAQARAEERFEIYGEEAIQSVIYDLFDGRKVAGLAIHDFMDDMAMAEIAAILLARTRDDEHAVVDAIEKQVKDNIRQWCEQDVTGRLEIEDRIRGAMEDRT